MVLEVNNNYMAFDQDNNILLPFEDEKIYKDRDGAIHYESELDDFISDGLNDAESPLLTGEWKEWSDEKEIDEALKDGSVIHVDEKTDLGNLGFDENENKLALQVIREKFDPEKVAEAEHLMNYPFSEDYKKICKDINAYNEGKDIGSSERYTKFISVLAENYGSGKEVAVPFDKLKSIELPFDDSIAWGTFDLPVGHNVNGKLDEYFHGRVVLANLVPDREAGGNVYKEKSLLVGDVAKKFENEFKDALTNKQDFNAEKAVAAFQGYSALLQNEIQKSFYSSASEAVYDNYMCNQVVKSSLAVLGDHDMNPFRSDIGYKQNPVVAKDVTMIIDKLDNIYNSGNADIPNYNSKAFKCLQDESFKKECIDALQDDLKITRARYCEYSNFVDPGDIISTNTQLLVANREEILHGRMEAKESMLLNPSDNSLAVKYQEAVDAVKNNTLVKSYDVYKSKFSDGIRDMTLNVPVYRACSGSSIKDSFISSAFYAVARNEEKHSVVIPQLGCLEYSNCNFHKAVECVLNENRFEPGAVIKRCNEIMKEYGIPRKFDLKDFPEVVKKMQQEKLVAQKAKSNVKDVKTDTKVINKNRSGYDGRD